MKCDRCKRSEPVYFREYEGRSLCKRCFLQTIEKRAREEIRRYGGISGKKVLVAVSGGKDSNAALYILWKIAKRSRAELQAISIDEGIKGYRKKSLTKAEELCESLGIEHQVISFKEEIGVTMDQISELGSPCTYCGVLRRKLLNEYALKGGFDFVATGHNLDDEAQSILMNLMRGNIKRLLREENPKNGLVPRIKPLRLVPEEEVVMYSEFRGIPYYQGECPYVEMAFRKRIRDFLREMKKESPGVLFNLVRSWEKVRNLKSKPDIKLNKCEICGSPTSREICKACELMDIISLEFT